MVTQKTIKSNKTWPLICRVNCQPIEKKTKLDSWVNLNLSSNNVETDVVVIVWTLADMPEQGKQGRPDDVRLQALLSSAS